MTASSIVVRAALRDELFPIPAELPWADWYLGVRAAQVSRVAYLSEPKTAYRFHGANMSLGSTGAVRLRELRKALALQRWFLRRLPVPATPVADLEHAWDAFGRLAVEALEVAGTPFARLVDVTGDERARAVDLAAEAGALLHAGRRHDALGAAVRAAATDPALRRGPRGAARRARAAARRRRPAAAARRRRVRGQRARRRARPRAGAARRLRRGAGRPARRDAGDRRLDRRPSRGGRPHRRARP